MKFGDKIIVNHRLRRKSSYGMTRETSKYWEEEKLTPIEAIVIGRRTLSNGISEWNGEIGIIYFPSKYFKAILVVTDMKNNPFYVKEKEES